MTRPIGTFTRKASRQDTSTSAPPTTRPITEPTPVIAANTAVAALRAGPFGNVVATSARPVGEAIAAPTPCSRRRDTSVVSSQAMPHSTDAMVNSATPTMNVRLRPMVSPSRPPSSIRPPNVSTYGGDHPAAPGIGQATARPGSWATPTIATVLSIVASSCMPPIAMTAAR